MICVSGSSRYLSKQGFPVVYFRVGMYSQLKSHQPQVKGLKKPLRSHPRPLPVQSMPMRKDPWPQGRPVKFTWSWLEGPGNEIDYVKYIVITRTYNSFIWYSNLIQGPGVSFSNFVAQLKVISGFTIWPMFALGMTWHYILSLIPWFPFSQAEWHTAPPRHLLYGSSNYTQCSDLLRTTCLNQVAAQPGRIMMSKGGGRWSFQCETSTTAMWANGEQKVRPTRILPPTEKPIKLQELNFSRNACWTRLYLWITPLWLLQDLWEPKSWRIQLCKMWSKMKNYHATTSLGLPNPRESVVETTDRPALADHTHRHGPRWWAQTGRLIMIQGDPGLATWKNLSTISENLQIRGGNLHKIQLSSCPSFPRCLWSKPFHQRATNDALRFCLGSCRV